MVACSAVALQPVSRRVVLRVFAQATATTACSVAALLATAATWR